MSLFNSDPRATRLLKRKRGDSRPLYGLQTQKFLYWGNASSQTEFQEEMLSLGGGSKETRVLSVGETHHIYFVPNAEYWKRFGHSGPPEDTPRSLWHALPT